ncbi:TatD family hydrolase [Thermodesulfatator atlanticus]|uniref:TatD family hydrolase n=1 Tax=Thermodesulfatator atlanticus TaxID=501497 RepID=UPI0003B63D86|nr:TatD family hydrolase [Thermodesulfatator atlanticus]
MAKLIDTHAHLNLPGSYKKDLPEVIARAKEGHVEKIINVGIEIKTSIRALELAREYEGLFATAGIHPHEVKKVNSATYDTLKALLADEKIVAVGEIGLDYAKEYSPRELQKEHFARQLALAREFKLPVVIHSREAYPDILEVLKEELPEKFVFHCYAGTVSEARKILDLGGFLSFTGIITFPKGENVREVVRFAPLDRIMAETDCPFLTPVPHRGKRNEPAFVRYVVEKIAELKNISFEKCAEATTKCAEEFFGI